MREKQQDIVIGIDSSTQSTKAVAWNTEGEMLGEGRMNIPLSMPQAGYAEQDCADWWRAAGESLKTLTRQIDSARVAGIAVSNQRETVAFLDGQGEAVRPAMVWLDERARSELDKVEEEFGNDRLHQLNGKPPDITPVFYRLKWMHTHHPQQLKSIKKIVDVHSFLCYKLTGRFVASWTSADPSGTFDIREKKWSQPVLDYLELEQNQFADTCRPGSFVGSVHEAAARETGLLEGTAVYAAGGDGQCAGLGVNATRQGQVYLNLGTALITGAWSADARISHHWRTMTSPNGEGYFLEGVQRAGTLLLDWFVNNFIHSSTEDKRALLDALEKRAEAIEIGSGGVTVCPYLTGCMDPHWDPAARASFHGLSPNHGREHVYRALLEALTLESARFIENMRLEGMEPVQIIAVGGGGNSKLWTKMFCDATGLPLSVSQSLEASSLGAAMSAAVGAGWFPGFAEAAERMSRMQAPIMPDLKVKPQWDLLSARQARAYTAGRL